MTVRNMEIMLHMDLLLTNKIQIVIMVLLRGGATIQVKKLLKIRLLKKSNQKLILKKGFKQ
jgi:hypothetical protein